MAEYLGIDPREVGYRCIFGTATRTFFVSPSHAEWLAARIPNAIMHWCPGEDISSSWTTSNRSWSLRHPERLDELGMTDLPVCVG